MTTSINIESGHILYGQWNNIMHGYQHNVVENNVGDVGEMLGSETKSGGTVLFIEHDYHIPAVNGEWMIYPLKHADDIRGYVACHNESYSTHETRCNLIRMLDDVAGIGVNHHDEDTIDNGVILVGRYAWDTYDRRHNDAVEGGYSNYFRSPTCFLVDSKHYNNEFQPFFNQGLVHERELQADENDYEIWEQNRHRNITKIGNHCVCMSTEGEYMHGRMVVNNERTGINAFMFFDHYVPDSFSRLTINDVNIIDDDDDLNQWSATYASEKVIEAAKRNDIDEIKRIVDSGINLKGVGGLFATLYRGFGTSHGFLLCHEDQQISRNSIHAYLLTDAILRQFKVHKDLYPMLTVCEEPNELVEFFDVFGDLPLDLNMIYYDSECILSHYILFGNFEMVQALVEKYNAKLDVTIKHKYRDKNPNETQSFDENMVDYFIQRYATVQRHESQQKATKDEVEAYEQMWLWIKKQNVLPLYLKYNEIVEDDIACMYLFESDAKQSWPYIQNLMRDICN